MKNEMTYFERAIMEEIIIQNEGEYPFLKEHLPHLNVSSRENTGVGMYVNFGYNIDTIENNPVEKHITLSSS